MMLDFNLVFDFPGLFLSLFFFSNFLCESEEGYDGTLQCMKTTTKKTMYLRTEISGLTVLLHMFSLCSFDYKLVFKKTVLLGGSGASDFRLKPSL